MRFTAGVMLCLLLSGCRAGDPATDPAPDVALDKWRQTGAVRWVFSGPVVEAGPAEETGFLISNEPYREAVITVEFWIEDETNSGIFVRCAKPTTITPDDCYEINIWDNHPQQEFRTGSIVKRQSPLARIDTLGKWNACRIDLRGKTITVTMNGIVTARVEDAVLLDGYIALQYGGKGVVRFRNFRLSLD